ncbi:MAG: hypothetical protein K2G89_09685 [Lachnospiraceae bacterium]|nr:hypothetical protein [Lachnospiraceae bacterium]
MFRIVTRQKRQTDILSVGLSAIMCEKITFAVSGFDLSDVWPDKWQ